MKKLFIRNVFSGLLFGLSFVVGVGLFVMAASLTVTSGSPLTATNWNSMVSNFFWGSGSSGIYYNGKVGIGTTSPLTQLHISDSTEGVIRITGNSGVGDLAIGSSAAILRTNTSIPLVFTTNGTERLRITETGNVGIGTQNPTSKFDVAGDIKATNGGTIGVTRIQGTWGSSSTHISNNYWTYVGDNIVLPAGNWIVYYNSFYDNDGITSFSLNTYNHPFLFLNNINNDGSSGIGGGGLSICNYSFCPVNGIFYVTVSSTTTYYIKHFINSYSGNYATIRAGWGNFYAIKTN